MRRADRRRLILEYADQSAPWTPAAWGSDWLDYYDVADLSKLTLDGSNGVSAAAPTVGADTLLQGTPANRLVYTAAQFGTLGGLVGSPSTSKTLNFVLGTPLAQPCTLYFVYKGLDGTNRVLFDASVGGRQQLSITTAAGASYLYANAVVNIPGSISNAAHAWCVVWNGAASAVYIDDPATAIVTGNPGASNLGSLGVGAVAGGNTPSGAYGAFGWTKTAHDAAKRALMFAYLKARFGTP